MQIIFVITIYVNMAVKYLQGNEKVIIFVA